LGTRSFLEAMVNARWREQYEDAVSTHLRAQEIAGLDICTDGDAHYDEEVGGFSWQSYPLTHMAGLSREVELTPPAVAAASPPRGHILHDQLEARVLPRIVGPLGPGDLQYTAMWKTAQRLTTKPAGIGIFTALDKEPIISKAGTPCETMRLVAMVLGTNIVRQELGIAEAECLAADPRYSLAVAFT
jgi:hypothetical protein